jgi:serine/threonine protein phosphatase PrpC
VLATSLSTAELPAPFSERAYAMMVADGIGGVGAGAVASRLALSTLAQLAIHFGKWNVRVDPAVAEAIMDQIDWFYNRIQETVATHSLTERGLSTMATALTAAYSAGDDLFIAHIGHSRAYICREGHLTALTRDHTLAAKGYPGPRQLYQQGDGGRALSTLARRRVVAVHKRLDGSGRRISDCRRPRLPAQPR